MTTRNSFWMFIAPGALLGCYLAVSLWISGMTAMPHEGQSQPTYSAGHLMLLWEIAKPSETATAQLGKMLEDDPVPTQERFVQIREAVCAQLHREARLFRHAGDNALHGSSCELPSTPDPSALRAYRNLLSESPASVKDQFQSVEDAYPNPSVLEFQFNRAALCSLLEQEATAAQAVGKNARAATWLRPTICV